MIRAGLLLALLATRAGYGASVRVVDGGCDLRAAPSASAFVISHVPGGETLQADDDVSGDWIAIHPPDRISLWIYGDLVRQGAAIAPKVQIRAGPGINYEVVGTVGRGEALNVRNAQGVWMEISPTPGCRVWVQRSHVRTGSVEQRKVDQPLPSLDTVVPAGRRGSDPVGGRSDIATNAVARPVSPVVPAVRQPPPPVPVPVAVARAPIAPPPVAAVRAPVAPSTVAPVRAPVAVVRPSAVRPSTAVSRVKPPIPSGAGQPDRQSVRRAYAGQVNLPADAESVGVISVDGVVRPMGLFSSFMSRPYRLVRRDPYNRAVTVCELTGGGEGLAAAVGFPVRIRGEQFLSDRSRYPIVAVARIERLASEPPPVAAPFLR